MRTLNVAAGEVVEFWLEFGYWTVEVVVVDGEYWCVDVEQVWSSKHHCNHRRRCHCRAGRLWSSILDKQTISLNHTNQSRLLHRRHGGSELSKQCPDRVNDRWPPMGLVH